MNAMPMEINPKESRKISNILTIFVAAKIVHPAQGMRINKEKMMRYEEY